MPVQPLSEMLPIFEGRTSWMYLDSDGTVTVGVGHALFTLADAIAVFHMMPDEYDEWNAVKNASLGFPAAEYEALTTCRLTDIQIDSLLTKDLANAESQLAALWPVYRTLPEGPKCAVLDMAFNLGATKLLREFPKFVGALSADPPDYKTAAAECVRIGVQPERNEWTKACLLSAAEREG